jgi:hypothetical protein
MRRLIVLVIIVLAGLLAYNFVTTGTLSLRLPVRSGAQSELADLERQFAQAKAEFEAAARAAGLTGVDMSSQAAAAHAKMERIQKSLDEFKQKAKAELAQQADKLQQRIEEFKRQLR